MAGRPLNRFTLRSGKSAPSLGSARGVAGSCIHTRTHTRSSPASASSAGNSIQCSYNGLGSSACAASSVHAGTKRRRLAWLYATSTEIPTSSFLPRGHAVELMGRHVGAGLLRLAALARRSSWSARNAPVGEEKGAAFCRGRSRRRHSRNAGQGSFAPGGRGLGHDASWIGFYPLESLERETSFELVPQTLEGCALPFKLFPRACRILGKSS